MSTRLKSASLSAELFKSIVNSLKSDKAGRIHELRSGPRVGVRGKLEVVLLAPDGRPVGAAVVWVRDVSVDGIGILHTKALKVGSRFVARFPRHDEGSLTLVYAVTHAKDVTKGLYTIGAQLLTLESDPVRDE